MISGKVKVKASVISQLKPRAEADNTRALIISDITKTKANNCFIIHCFEENNHKCIITPSTVYF